MDRKNHTISRSHPDDDADMYIAMLQANGNDVIFMLLNSEKCRNTDRTYMTRQD